MKSLPPVRTNCWSTRGDEALLCLEMFWRNERWEMLFPHAKLTAIANN